MLTWMRSSWRWSASTSRPCAAAGWWSAGKAGAGVVASASYEARELGVRSATPMSMARRMCPGLVVVPPRQERYHAVSERIFAIFRGFTPLVEGLSLDEAFMDVSGLRRHYGDSRAVADAVRGRIRSELGLPASVGIAGALYLAKMASGRAKPDGRPCNSRGFRDGFPERAGSARSCGESATPTQERIEAMGIRTVGELARLSGLRP